MRVSKRASKSPYSEGHENSSPSEMEDMGMEHTLRISVSKEPASGGIVSCRHISVRERFLRFLLGEKRRVAIIVPGDSVRELAVSEIMEGGNVHGKSEVTA